MLTLNDFHFLRPYFLLLALPMFALLLFFFRSQKNANGWHQICKKDLMPHILVSQTKKSLLPMFLSFFTFFLLIIALAGPTWNQLLEPVFKRQSSLVIVMDLSDTMNADDIKPSRLKRAIYKINDLLELRKDGQTALIVFSGSPFVVTPLTDDIATIQAQLPVLETRIMPTKGHRADIAVKKALELLNQAGVYDGSILLVTSELSSADLEKTMKLILETKSKIAVLGVGGESTTPILSVDGGFIKDKNGSLMMTTLPIDNLKRLSKSTNSMYQTIALDDSDIHQLAYEFSAGFSDLPLSETLLGLKKWQDEGYLFVLLALPFVSLIFRRGVLIILIFLMPQIIEATVWSDYFQTADARGEELYKLEDYQQAKETFENPDWKATAHYQLKEYEQAAEIYQLNKSAEGLYNYGTARAKVGDFEKALEAYSKVLDIEPHHEDAIYNKNIIEEFQKQQNNQESNKDSQKESQKDKNKDSKDGDQDSKDGDKDESDSQDGDEEEDSEGSESKDQKQDDKDTDSQDESQESEKNNKEIDEKEKEDLKDDYRDQVEKELSENEEKQENEEIAKENVEEKNNPPDEDLQRQIDERWLQHVKDDPGGLLRRKFMQQYQRTNGSRK